MRASAFARWRLPFAPTRLPPPPRSPHFFFFFRFFRVPPFLFLAYARCSLAIRKSIDSTRTTRGPRAFSLIATRHISGIFAELMARSLSARSTDDIVIRISIVYILHLAPVLVYKSFLKLERANISIRNNVHATHPRVRSRLYSLARENSSRCEEIAINNTVI